MMVPDSRARLTVNVRIERSSVGSRAMAQMEDVKGRCFPSERN